MTDTYTPSGTGLCATCGRDVGAHDCGHTWVNSVLVGTTAGHTAAWQCGECFRPPHDPVHDVGRVLTCPSEITNLGRVTIYPEVRDD